MARKLAHEGGGGDGRDRSSGRHELAGLARRGYLRLVSAAIVAIASVTGQTAASDSASGSESKRRLLIEGRGNVSMYELTVDGELDPGTGATDEDAARISGHSTEGVVKGKRRCYRFSGDIRDLSVSGDAGIYLRGDRTEVELSLTDEEYASRETFPPGGRN